MFKHTGFESDRHRFKSWPTVLAMDKLYNIFETLFTPLKSEDNNTNLIKLSFYIYVTYMFKTYM